MCPMTAFALLDSPSICLPRAMALRQKTRTARENETDFLLAVRGAFETMLNTEL